MKNKNKDVDDTEEFTVEDVIGKVKNEAMTNVILLTHMSDLSLENKLYIAYFMGTRKGMPTRLSFDKSVWVNIGEHVKKKHPNAKYFGTYPDLEDGGDRCQLCGEKL